MKKILNYTVLLITFMLSFGSVNAQSQDKNWDLPETWHNCVAENTETQLMKDHGHTCDYNPVVTPLQVEKYSKQLDEFRAVRAQKSSVTQKDCNIIIIHKRPGIEHFAEFDKSEESITDFGDGMAMSFGTIGNIDGNSYTPAQYPDFNIVGFVEFPDNFPTTLTDVDILNIINTDPIVSENPMNKIIREKIAELKAQGIDVHITLSFTLFKSGDSGGMAIPPCTYSEGEIARYGIKTEFSDSSQYDFEEDLRLILASIHEYGHFLNMNHQEGDDGKPAGQNNPCTPNNFAEFSVRDDGSPSGSIMTSVIGPNSAGNYFEDNNTYFSSSNGFTGTTQLETLNLMSGTKIQDFDGDGISDSEDNCPDTHNQDQADSDSDGVGDVCDQCSEGDDSMNSDSDSLADACDNCPNASNEDQTDTDGDGIGDLCDPINDLDTDGDGINNNIDNCPDLANADQSDIDGDGIGDLCDPINDLDTDGDGVNNNVDNCPDLANADQSDIDGDGIGDLCDPINDLDTDGDGVNNNVDNCPDLANADQSDIDGDGIGDLCDPINDLDTDGDGINNNVDNCPDLANADQSDIDGDGIGDLCDPVNDLDTDGDGVNNNVDNCPDLANADQSDIDGDGIGDLCDPINDLDTDGDGINNNVDNCPDLANADQSDIDGDGLGDLCDPVNDLDTDGDGINNNVDNCPDTHNQDQADFDGDGVGDVCDQCSEGDDTIDTDSDGMADACDECPTNGSLIEAQAYWIDADGDGLGDFNSDPIYLCEPQDGFVTNNDDMMDEPNAVNNVELLNALRVYPNPVSDRLYIEISSDKNIEELSLFNILGQTIFTQKNPQSITIEVSGFEKGYHLLQIRSKRDQATISIIIE